MHMYWIWSLVASSRSALFRRSETGVRLRIFSFFAGFVKFTATAVREVHEYPTIFAERDNASPFDSAPGFFVVGGGSGPIDDE